MTTRQSHVIYHGSIMLHHPFNRGKQLRITTLLNRNKSNFSFLNLKTERIHGMCRSYAIAFLALTWLSNSHGFDAKAYVHPYFSRKWSSTNQPTKSNHGRWSSSSLISSTFQFDQSTCTPRGILSHSRSYSSYICRFCRTVKDIRFTYVFTFPCLHLVSTMDSLFGTNRSYIE